MKKLIYLVAFLIVGFSCYGQLDTINTGNGYNNGSGDNLNVITKKVNKNDKYLNTQIGLKASSTHTHGNITNVGAIGATSGLPIITTASGVLTTGTFGNTSGTFAQGNDSRLSDSRTPNAHNQAESTITFTDITTGNATTSNHGYLPKLGGGTTNFLRADGSWAAPSGGGSYTATAPIVVTGTVISVDTTKAKNKIATYSDVQILKAKMEDTTSLSTVALLLSDTSYHDNRPKVVTDYANRLKQNSITLTTTGSSGAATLTGSTLNIPQYAGGVSGNSNFSAGLHAMGSDFKGMTLGLSSPGSGSFQLYDGLAYFAKIYLDSAMLLHGVVVGETTEGIYTGDNFNGAALYSISGTTFTRVAISANNANLWKVSAYDVTIPFTSNYSVPAKGLYAVMLLYNYSAESTAPVIVAGTSWASGMASRVFKVGNFYGTKANQTTLATSYVESDFNGTGIPVLITVY